MPNTPDSLNFSQVAPLLGIHPQIARQMARQGRLPAYQPGGQRAWVFHRDEVLEWLKAHPSGSWRQVAEVRDGPVLP